MSADDDDDLFGGADVSDGESKNEKPPETHNEVEAARVFGETQFVEDDMGGYGDEDEEEEEERKKKAEEAKKEVLPRCPDIVGDYKSLWTMRLPRVVKTVREPYTREGYIAAQKRERPSVADAEAEVLAMRWRRVNGRNETNARLVHWSDGTTQILVGNNALDVTQRSGGSKLHVGVSITPMVKQSLGFPNGGYVVEVPREFMKRRLQLLEESKKAVSSGEEEEEEEGEEIPDDIKRILDEYPSSSSDEDDEDEDIKYADDDDMGTRKEAQPKKKKTRGSVFVVGPIEQGGHARRQKSVSEQSEALSKKLAEKERLLKKKAGGSLEPDDLIDSDEDDEDEVGERLQRAKRQTLH